MAKILYGISGDNYGHSTRSREIINHLEKNGHEVIIAAYGKAYAVLKNDFKVIKIAGLFLSCENNKVDYIKTVINGFLTAPETIKSLNKLSEVIKKFKPDLIISDFEPLTALSSKLKNLPLISLDNQHFITRTKYSYPYKYKQEALITKLIIKSYVFKANDYIALSFFPAPEVKSRTSVLPPVLRKEVLEIDSKIGDYTLVYLNNKFKKVIEILKKIDEKFIVYGFDGDFKDGNLIFRKSSVLGFLNDLANSKAVIATAGFSLMSEAFYLGKPYLAIPLQNQFEQILNAYLLEKLGYGKHCDEIDQEKIESFLFNLNRYRENLKDYKREDNEKIFKKIDEIIEKYT